MKKQLENILIDVLNALFKTYGRNKGLKIFKILFKYIRL